MPLTSANTRRARLLLLPLLCLLPACASAAPTAAQVVDFLAPWQFSPTVLSLTLLTLVVYVNGLRVRHARGQRSSVARPFAFLLGVVLIYFVLQTRFDYWAQHMFYIHRGQHLVLHHIGPFLIALSVPHKVLRAGIPDRWWDAWVGPVMRSWPVRGTVAVLMDPILAPVLFVVGIGFWLIPAVHFDAMLSLPLYNLMNWSMLVDGLPFWWLVLNPEPKPPARIGYGMRIFILWIVMFPQIAIGAFIGLSTHDLFHVYAICGRLYPISPITDQQIGGLIIWIPGAMMSAISMLLVLAHTAGHRRAARFEAVGVARPATS
ncbi:MAG TPA: cytochrome c oxidase assembly protein [Nevskiaceae bacterium]|nr:cytochrome c oxidase assembly protein [Nevskiaceae bacterium]